LPSYSKQKDEVEAKPAQSSFITKNSPKKEQTSLFANNNNNGGSLFTNNNNGSLFSNNNTSNNESTSLFNNYDASKQNITSMFNNNNSTASIFTSSPNKDLKKMEEKPKDTGLTLFDNEKNPDLPNNIFSNITDPALKKQDSASISRQNTAPLNVQPSAIGDLFKTNEANPEHSSPSKTKQNSSLFGDLKKTNSLFGNLPSSQTNNNSTSLFGNLPAGNSIFGTLKDASPPKPEEKKEVPQSNLFASLNNPTSGGSLFAGLLSSGNNNQTGQSKGSIFSGNISTSTF